MKDIGGRNYRILATIATGGTAVLYKAIQTSLDRPVVIKRLHSHLTSDPNFTRRFELEAKAAASLDHENIVRIIDFGSSQDNYYIVMEYIDGMSLKELIARRKLLDEEIALLVAHEICMGLDHAHQRGITHRDVKPANIMFTSEGQVKITDFGLAKLQQSPTQETLTSTLLGTPLYMSPEQAIGEQIDGRSDIFSLGTICYEMITGTQPFMGDNYAAVIRNIIDKSPPPPSRIGKGIEPAVDHLIATALAHDPGERFGSALEMAVEIESILGQERILAARSLLRRGLCGGGRNARQRPAGRPRRRRRPFWTVATAAAIGAAAVYLWFNPGKIDLIKSLIVSSLRPDPVAPVEELITAGSDHGTGMPIDLIPADTAAVDSAAAPAMEPVPQAVEPPDGTAQQDSIPAPSVVDETTSGNDDGEETAIEREPEERPEPAPATGYLDISVEPPAEISVDGVARVHGSRYGPVEMRMGGHEITIRQTGYREYREKITIQRAELSRRRIILQPETGSIDLLTDAGVTVLIDGVFKGRTPLAAPLVLPAGTHRVELRKSGYQTWSNAVLVPTDEVVQLRINLTPL